MIILAHAVIPHHHHFECIEKHGTSECKNDSYDMDNRHTDMHCHAFNHIISQNENNPGKHLLPISYFNSDFTGIHTSISASAAINYIILTHRFIFSPQKDLILITHSLRGPPVISYS